MSESTKYFKVGIFFLTSLALFVIILALFGAGRYFKKTIRCETYFEQSVQGLDIGAPVKYIGVKIGEVKKIFVLPSEFLSLSLSSKAFYRSLKYIVVDFDLDVSRFRDIRGVDASKVIQKLVLENGLRARIEYTGITGVAYLGIDNFDPGKYPPTQIHWQPRYPYIPSISNPLARLGDFADTMMTSLEDDMVPILRVTHQTLGDNPEVGPKINELLDHANNTLKNLEEITASAKKYPSQLFLGGPPPKSKFDRS